MHVWNPQEIALSDIRSARVKQMEMANAHQNMAFVPNGGGALNLF